MSAVPRECRETPQEHLEQTLSCRETHSVCKTNRFGLRAEPRGTVRNPHVALLGECHESPITPDGPNQHTLASTIL